MALKRTAAYVLIAASMNEEAAIRRGLRDGKVE
jgi:hypothetical protein